MLTSLWMETFSSIDEKPLMLRKDTFNFDVNAVLPIYK